MDSFLQFLAGLGHGLALCICVFALIGDSNETDNGRQDRTP